MILPNCAPSGGGDSSTEASDEDEDDSASVPVSVSGSNLVFTVESGIDPETVEGYIVGEPGQLIVEPYFDPEDPEFNPKEIENLLYVIKDVPLGEYDVIVQADTLLVDDGVKLQDGTRTNGIRLADVKFEADKNTQINALSIPPMGTIEGLAKKFEKENHELIAVDFPGTKIPTRKTDALGKYVLNPIPVGVHEVVFSSDGYQTTRLEDVTVSTAVTTTNPDVILYPSGGVFGVVEINGGDSITASATVNVTVRNLSPNAILYRPSLVDNFSGVKYIAIEGTSDFTFSQTLDDSSDGEQTVYVQLADEDGIESVLKDSIILDAAAPKSATTLTWNKSSPTGSKTLSASWVKSTSKDISKQSIELFKSTTCTKGTEVLGSKKALKISDESHSFADLETENSYTFKITTFDASEDFVSSCSPKIDIIKNWVAVGSANFSPGGVQYLTITSNAGTPYVAFQDESNSDQAAVYKFDGTNWTELGTSGQTSDGAAFETVVGFMGGEAILAFRTSTELLYVTEFDGTNWGAIANLDDGGVGNGWDLDAIVYGSKLIVAHQERSVPLDGDPVISEFDGTSWTDVGNVDDNNEGHDIQVAYDGTNYYTAYKNWNGKLEFIKNFTGTPIAGLVTGNIDSIDAVYSNGKTYIAYSDDSNKVVVASYDTAWGQLGGTVEEIQADSIAMTVVNNEIHVAYTNQTNNKISVKKFNGTDWVQIGETAELPIAKDIGISTSGGKLFISYEDRNTSKANVFELK
jgi:hypothetical protein